MEEKFQCDVYAFDPRYVDPLLLAVYKSAKFFNLTSFVIAGL